MLTEYIQSQLRTVTDKVYTSFNTSNDYPCIIHMLDNTDPIQCMNKAVNFENFQYDIEIWSETKSEGETLALAVKTLFDNTSSSADDINKIRYNGRRETWTMITAGSTYDETKKVFGTILSFDFWYYYN